MKTRLSAPSVQAAAIKRGLQERGPIAVSALLGLGLALQVGTTLLGFRASDLATQQPAIATGAQTAPSPDALASTILSGNLFGEAPAPRVTVGAPAADRFTLVGTIATDQADRGLAILSDKTGDSHLFRVGAEIQAGANLLKVFWDHILVARGALVETLALRRTGTGPATFVAQEDPPKPVVRTAEEDRKFEPPPLPAAGALLQILRLHPVSGQGRPVGFAVNHAVQAKPWLAALGLQSGDIIVSPTNTGEILDTVAAKKPLLLGVERADLCFKSKSTPTGLRLQPTFIATRQLAVNQT